MNLTMNLDQPKIIIQYLQRNGKKGWTHIYGIEKIVDDDLFVKISKSIQEKCACGLVIKNEKGVKYMQLQGDHREKIKKILLSKNIIEESNIILRGA